MKKNLLIVALLTFYCQFSFSTEYQILLSRPYEKGDTVTKSTKTATSMKALILDKTGKKVNGQSRTFDVDYNANETVKKVNDDGKILELVAQINKLTLKAPEGENVLIPKGKILTAVTDKDKTLYSVDGKPLSANVLQFISDIVSTHHSNELNPDKLCGSDKKKKVGDKWKINSALMEKEIESGVFGVTDVKGTVELKSVEKINGIECLLLVTNIEAKVDLYKTTNIKVKNGFFKLKVLTYYPVDLKKHVQKEVLDLSTHIDLPTPNKDGWITRVEASQHMESDSKF